MAVMQKLCDHIKPTEQLAKDIRRFRVGFMTKNPEHMAFFGGNLTGVHIVRFTPADRDRFFNEICLVDEDELYDALCETSAINPAWQVSSDAFNHMCMWLIHLFLTSKLNQKLVKAATMEVAMILYYRFITSIMFHFFKYPVDTTIAEAVYAQMSNKYSIKQLGSWQKVIEDKCEKLLSTGSIHYKTLREYKDDASIIYLINDTQGRNKDLIKNIYALFDKVRKEGYKVHTSSMILEMEGDFILKDKVNGLQNYIRYMEGIIPDRHSFIKQELVDIVCKIQFTAPPQIVEKTLLWCSVNYNYTKDNKIKLLVEKTLLHSFEYLKDNRNVYKKNTDLPKLVSRLKGVYSSSRSSDPNLLEIRKLAEDIITGTKETKNKIVIASVRNALLLYIVIRAFTMHYFSKA